MQKQILFLLFASVVVCYRNICDDPNFGFIYPEPNTNTINSSCADPNINYQYETQYNATISFYRSLNGDHWINKGQWLNSNVSYCQWGGLTCDDNCMIKEIYMNQNNLYGSFPPEISMLTKLDTLNLFCNFITGGTEYLSKCTELTILALTSNLLKGSLDFIQNLKNLIVLELSNNYITSEIPIEIGIFHNLQIMDLSSNYITGSIPTELSKLTNLEVFNLGENNMTGTIPNIFVSMTKLKSIFLNNNNFMGMLPELYNKRISEVYVGSNHFTGRIPESWAKLNFLFNVHLDNNELTDNVTTFPDIFFNAKFLNISNNNFYGDFPDLYYMTGSTFIANNNNITSSLSYDVGTFTYIDVRNNPLMHEKYGIDRYRTTDSVVIYNSTIACPYLVSNYRTLILSDPNYYDYVFCYYLL
jgi:Leucine-rich repeat (LRR) protein